MRSALARSRRYSISAIRHPTAFGN
jgi:hypothetical protein